MALVSKDEIGRRLASLPGWELSGKEIRRVYTFPDFKGSMVFVNRVAGLAETMDHHPDILINYSKVTLTLTSHDAGGLTDKDFRLASQIDS
jgi:4a-hydroxytetrahydrobiopterin dehydratase